MIKHNIGKIAGVVAATAIFKGDVGVAAAVKRLRGSVTQTTVGQG